jgi:F-type H+-transporting ATPase subunit b
MRGLLYRRGVAGASFALTALLPGVGRAEETAGLPQLDVHSYASQLFWLVVFFAVVYAFMRYVGIPRVAAIVQQRRAQVDGDIGAADRLRKEALEVRKAYEAAMAEAHAKARQMLDETHERNMTILSERTKAATAELDATVGEAVRRIEDAQAEALRSIPELARALASDITVRLSGQVPPPAAVIRAVDDAAGREAA